MIPSDEQLRSTLEHLAVKREDYLRRIVGDTAVDAYDALLKGDMTDQIDILPIASAYNDEMSDPYEGASSPFEEAWKLFNGDVSRRLGYIAGYLFADSDRTFVVLERKDPDSDERFDAFTRMSGTLEPHGSLYVQKDRHLTNHGRESRNASMPVLTHDIDTVRRAIERVETVLDDLQ